MIWQIMYGLITLSVNRGVEHRLYRKILKGTNQKFIYGVDNTNDRSTTWIKKQ